MKFCPNCGNLLIPKDKMLFCKVCLQYFTLEKKDETQYFLIKQLYDKETAPTPIIYETPLKDIHITYEDRKAREELFIPYKK